MKYVDIYDSISKDRLLGSIRRPTQELIGRCYELAVLAPVSLDDVFDVRVSSIRFTYDYKVTDGGYHMDAVFRTDAPLKKLMLLRDFRLPGESENQAYRRSREVLFS